MRLLAAMMFAFAAAPAIAGTAETAGASKYFAGISLVDQNGRRVELYRDVMAGHTVVMHTFFAHCTASCPVTMNTLKALQARLGDRLGADVRLVSITVDPSHDTPSALHDYAARLDAHPGWYFLTGTREEVDAALKRIGQYTDDPADHMDLLIAGNDRTGLWKKILAAAPAASVSALVLGVADDRGG